MNSNIETTIQTSTKGSTWINKAKWSQDNKKILDINFEAAITILSTLAKNKASNTYPQNIEELSNATGFTHIKIDNLLSCSELFNEDTICKMISVLNIKTIDPSDFIEQLKPYLS